jgi:uncharacterized protein YyaL (SSP411 family)
MTEWMAWGAAAFERAARERKPVLLSITAAWSGACHEMDRTTYADARVAGAIRDRVVAVRVDADQRPDINDRYNLGGWPTTAFLTPSGAVITGGTFVPVERMADVVARVAAEYSAADFAKHPAADHADDADDAKAADPTAGPDIDAAAADAEHADELVFETFDEQFGGFGVEPKFPITAPLHLAMVLFQETGDDRWRFIVERTLDAMADGPLWDARAGGFYRYASTRDWQLPHHEKLLETNAALLRACAEAAVVFGRAVDRDRTAAISIFITSTLKVEGGGYRGSDADAILYVDANAMAAGALLGAATALDDSELAREALASFERVMLACYRPGAGLAHHTGTGGAAVGGLLADHVAAIGALLDAHEVSDGEPYRMMAEELGHVIVRDLWDGRRGGFLDRAPQPDDVGLLRRRRTPFVTNAEAAIAFARLSRLEPRKGFPDPALFRDRAIGALEAAARALEGQGPLAAHYALARRHL